MTGWELASVRNHSVMYRIDLDLDGDRIDLDLEEDRIDLDKDRIDLDLDENRIDLDENCIIISLVWCGVV